MHQASSLCNPATRGSVFPVYEASWIAFGVGSGIMFYNPRVTWSQDIWEVRVMVTVRVSISIRVRDSHGGSHLGEVAAPELLHGCWL